MPNLPPSGHEEGTDTQTPKAGDIPPGWLRGDTLDPVKSDSDEEENILQRIRDEVEFEAAHGITDTGEREEGDQPPSRQRPSSDGETGSVDETLLKRFEALGGLELPAVPKVEPGANKKPHFTTAAPADDDETDTWCCKLAQAIDVVCAPRGPAKFTSYRYMQRRCRVQMFRL